MVFPLPRNKLTGKFLLSCGSGIKTSETHIFTPLFLTWPFFEVLCLDPSRIYIENIVYDFLLPISHYNHPPSFSWVTPNCVPREACGTAEKLGKKRQRSVFLVATRHSSFIGYVRDSNRSPKIRVMEPEKCHLNLGFSGQESFYYQCPSYIHTYMCIDVCSLILLSYFSATFIFTKKVHLRWSHLPCIICLVLLPFQEQTRDIQCYFTHNVETNNLRRRLRELGHSSGRLTHHSSVCPTARLKSQWRVGIRGALCTG